MKKNELRMRLFLDLLSNDHDDGRSIHEQVEPQSTCAETAKLTQLFIVNPFKKIRENKA